MPVLNDGIQAHERAHFQLGVNAWLSRLIPERPTVGRRRQAASATTRLRPRRLAE